MLKTYKEKDYVIDKEFTENHGGNCHLHSNGSPFKKRKRDERKLLPIEFEKVKGGEEQLG